MNENLYNIYQNYYEKLVPICIHKWRLNGNELLRKRKFIFIEEFWSLKNSVIYIPIIFNNDNVNEEVRYISWAHRISRRETGYLMFENPESSAIINVADKAIVKNAFYNYYHNKSQYIEITPSMGYTLDKMELFNIQKSSWAGSISEIEFEKNKNYTPWMSSGQHRIFLDPEHKLTDKLKGIYSKGNVWELGKLLNLMTTNDKASRQEIEKLTGIQI